jgi:hypothetical protein
MCSCSEIVYRKAEAGDIIQMVSLDMEGSECITGMIVNRRLVEPLHHVMAAHQEQLTRQLQAAGINFVAQAPTSAESPARGYGAAVIKGVVALLLGCAAFLSAK